MRAIYLPLHPSCYGAPSKRIKGKQMNFADHKIVISQNGQTWIFPFDAGKLSVEKFYALKEKLSMHTVIIVDRVISKDRSTPIVQIIDHVNCSGINPLRGKTPYGKSPRFPDVSSIYSKEEIGLKQVVARSVGAARFLKENRSGDEWIAEFISDVSIVAGYAGAKVTGMGWNYRIDREGKALENFFDLVSKTIYSDN